MLNMATVYCGHSDFLAKSGQLNRSPEKAASKRGQP
jgi:hypothetical protein